MSIYDEPAKIKRMSLPADRRILVVSDIHGNLEYFQGLLKLCDFCGDDILVINGDFTEKGPDSLGTLRYIMELYKAGNVLVVMGNCDGWHSIFNGSPEAEHYIFHYLQYRRGGLVWEMLQSLGIDPLVEDNVHNYLPALHAFDEEFQFLASLPDCIETENFTFSHSGYEPGKALEEHSRGEIDRIDRFLDWGYSYDKWLIVGHYPVMLYCPDKVCANPIILPERKIASIDGACVLKDDGQLNALIIPHWDSFDFSFMAYDHFPERRVLAHQEEGRQSYYIRWGDSEVEVLERGEEFSHCRHVRTGYEMDILTKYLFTPEKITKCNDCTDYILPLEEGDIVRVVETTSRGYFVKHKGYSGWYFGELE